MDSQFIDFSMPSPLTSTDPELKRASPSSFNQSQSKFTTQEKGKGRAIAEIDESEMDMDRSSEEEDSVSSLVRPFQLELILSRRATVETLNLI